jgi:hypothetical protein
MLAMLSNAQRHEAMACNLIEVSGLDAAAAPDCNTTLRAL